MKSLRMLLETWRLMTEKTLVGMGYSQERAEIACQIIFCGDIRLFFRTFWANRVKRKSEYDLKREQLVLTAQTRGGGI